MNYWILQASPKQFLIDYFLDDYVKQNSSVVDWWLIESKFASKIKDRDIVYIWKAKIEPSTLPHYYIDWRDRTGAPKKIAGIYAVARVNGSVKPWPPTQQQLERSKKYTIDDPWDNLTNSYLIVDVTYDNPLDEPLREENIWQHPTLFYEGTDLGGFKKRRSRRSIKLTPKQGQIIWGLIYGSSMKE
jgi:hypothetical protein